MKKSLIVSLLAATTASFAFAGGIDTKNNLNVGFLRNPSRNTESSRPESAMFNIAGTGFMAKGLSIEGSNQFVDKHYWHVDKASDTLYIDNSPVLFYPNLDMVYKMNDHLAFSFAFMVAAGGGTLQYEQGTALTKAMGKEVDVTSITYGENLGVAYKFNDKVSVGAAVRFLQGNQKLSIDSNTLGDPGFNAWGYGVGGIFGVHVKPVAALDLSAQYKTITKMKMKFTDVDGNLRGKTLLKNGNPAAHLEPLNIAEDNKFNNDLPAELNLGAGYHINDGVYVSGSFNYYFNKQADMGTALGGQDLDWDDSWELSGGVDWKAASNVMLSAGLLYAKQGYTGTVNNLLGPVLNSISFGTGMEWQVIKPLKITTGVMVTEYFEDDYTSLGKEYELDKRVVQGAIAFTYTPF